MWGLDCLSPPAPSRPLSSIPSGLWCLIPFLGGLGVGQSLGSAPGQSMCSPRGWIRAALTHLEPGAPCTSCPGCCPHPKSRMPGTATPLPRTGMFSGCCCSPPHRDKAGSRNCLPQLLGCSRLPLSPQPCTQGSPYVLKAEALGQPRHSEGSWGCAQPWIPGVLQLLPHLQSQEGWEQQEPGPGLMLELCKQHPGLAFPEVAHVK